MRNSRPAVSSILAPFPASALGVALLCGSILAAGMLAARALAPSRPPIVAVVDLEKVFNTIESHDAREAKLEATTNEFTAKLTDLEEAVKELQGELDSFQPGSQSALELQGRVQAAVGEYKAFEQFVRLKLESEKARAMRDTYLEIRDGTKRFATERSIDFVLLDDSIPELERANSQRTVQQISARRILFANTEFDISDDLIAYLNAEFKGNSTAGTPASSGSSGAGTPPKSSAAGTRTDAP